MGSANAAVLPVPVWARPMRSWPASTMGIDCSWTGVGWCSPHRARLAGSPGSGPGRRRACSAPGLRRDPPRRARSRARVIEGVAGGGADPEAHRDGRGDRSVTRSMAAVYALSRSSAPSSRERRNEGPDPAAPTGSRSAGRARSRSPDGRRPRGASPRSRASPARRGPGIAARRAGCAPTASRGRSPRPRASRPARRRSRPRRGAAGPLRRPRVSSSMTRPQATRSSAMLAGSSRSACASVAIEPARRCRLVDATPVLARRGGEDGEPVDRGPRARARASSSVLPSAQAPQAPEPRPRDTSRSISASSRRASLSALDPRRSGPGLRRTRNAIAMSPA